MSGIKCPHCGLNELSGDGFDRGKCDECYERDITCVICGNKVDPAIELHHITGIGNGHQYCLKSDVI